MLFSNFSTFLLKFYLFYLHSLSQNSITLQMISQNISKYLYLYISVVSLHVSLDLRVLKFSSVIKMWAQRHCSNSLKIMVNRMLFFMFFNRDDSFRRKRVLHIIKPVTLFGKGAASSMPSWWSRQRALPGAHEVPHSAGEGFVRAVGDQHRSWPFLPSAYF